MDSPADRLRRLRLDLGFATAADVCARFGWPVGTYRSHENGHRELSRKAAETYARALKTTAGFLLFGERLGQNQAGLTEASRLKLSPETHSESEFGRVVQVPVLGETAAGKWLEFEDVDTEKYAPILAIAGRYPVSEQFAYRVVGPSMDKARIFDGDFVICVPYWHARTAPTTGDLVVVERRRGPVFERTVKELQVADGGFELWPRSTDPRFQQPIKVPKNHDLLEEDGTTIEIVGLVVASYVSRT